MVRNPQFLTILFPSVGFTSSPQQLDLLWSLHSPPRNWASRDATSVLTSSPQYNSTWRGHPYCLQSTDLSPNLCAPGLCPPTPCIPDTQIHLCCGTDPAGQVLGHLLYISVCIWEGEASPSKQG